jgi:hypothetical protein
LTFSLLTPPSDRRCCAHLACHDDYFRGTAKNADAHPGGWFEGVRVRGEKTPEPFVNACSLFTYVEGLGQPPVDPGVSPESEVDPKKFHRDTRLVLLVRNAVEAASGDDGWAHLAAVGSQIGNQTSLDPRNYGYRKLSDLIEGVGLFDLTQENLQVMVRDKRTTVRATT